MGMLLLLGLGLRAGRKATVRRFEGEPGSEGMAAEARFNESLSVVQGGFVCGECGAGNVVCERGEAVVLALATGLDAKAGPSPTGTVGNCLLGRTGSVIGRQDVSVRVESLVETQA